MKNQQINPRSIKRTAGFFHVRRESFPATEQFPEVNYAEPMDD